MVHEFMLFFRIVYNEHLIKKKSQITNKLSHCACDSTHLRLACWQSEISFILTFFIFSFIWRSFVYVLVPGQDRARGFFLIHHHTLRFSPWPGEGTFPRSDYFTFSLPPPVNPPARLLHSARHFDIGLRSVDLEWIALFCAFLFSLSLSLSLSL